MSAKTENSRRDMSYWTGQGFIPNKRMKMEGKDDNEGAEAEAVEVAAKAVEVVEVVAEAATVVEVGAVKGVEEKSGQETVKNENKNTTEKSVNSQNIDMEVEVTHSSTNVNADMEEVATAVSEVASTVAESKVPCIQDQDITESIDDFFRSLNDETERRARHDYHMLIFENDAFDGNARPTKAEAKRATVVERIEAVITNPKRQLKKPLARRDIFYIVYLLCTQLNCRSTLQLMHLSASVNRNIRILWHMILPLSLKQYVHSPSIIRLFSGMKESTWEQRCMVLKSYFDENLWEICECVRNNFDIIRYIFSVCHAEVYYSTDDGLEITKRMGELDAELWMHTQNRSIQPYDVISTKQTYV